MDFEEIKSLLKSQFEDDVVSIDTDATPNALLIQPAAVKAICVFCRDHKQLYFYMLSCLTGIDNGPEEATMEVVYNLYSIPFGHSLMLKTIIDRRKPEIASVAKIWRTAEWHEREAFDLLGIRFRGHPDLRRILLPDDWIGHPLRKDYVEQDKYHGVTVVYDRDENQDPDRK